MKRTLGLLLFFALFSLPLLAAKNSETFVLPSEVRVGDTTLPEGHCKVTWTDASGPQVQLTIKMDEGKKTIGYLVAFHTKNATFIVQDPPKEVK